MQNPTKASALALLPLLVFLGIYLAGSIIANDFYKIPITVAGMAASIVAIAMTRHRTIAESIGDYSRGATDHNIMLMIWIFVLAGAFASSTKAMGAVDAIVDLTLRIVPEAYLPAGIFFAACFTSLSIGTSVGTIVALTPIASAISAETGCSMPWIVAIVVGGALFGDNLSFISDTTIAATRTQGCSMRDKFRTNVAIVAPAAVITLLIYIFSSEQSITYVATSIDSPWYTMIPYLLVLVMAAAGVNVLKVLVAGILSSGLIGICCGRVSVLDWFSTMGQGIDSMGQLIIISIGSIARDIGQRFGIAPRRVASLLDTFSCFIQGILPYGAQLLMAAGLAAISPVEIIRYLYYPVIMGLCAALAIVIQRPRCID